VVRQAFSRQLRCGAVAFDDVKMHAHNDTVIVTGVVNAEATELGSRHDFDVHEQNTDPWGENAERALATQQTVVLPTPVQREG
jgi:hypothetical protein